MVDVRDDRDIAQIDDGSSKAKPPGGAGPGSGFLVRRIECAARGEYRAGLLRCLRQRRFRFRLCEMMAPLVDRPPRLIEPEKERHHENLADLPVARPRERRGENLVGLHFQRVKLGHFRRGARWRTMPINSSSSIMVRLRLRAEAWPSRPANAEPRMPPTIATR